jgi:predicted N-acetyltransferase YhbS
MTHTVRPFTAADADAVFPILRAAFPRDTDTAIHNVIAVASTGGIAAPLPFVAVANDTVVGFVQATCVLQRPPVDFICWLAVDERHRRQGIGGALITAAENAIRTDRWQGGGGTIMVVSDTSPDYYQKLGYQRGAADYFNGQPVMVKAVAAQQKAA